MRILITGGGSEEPIDNVRSVCNFSTGKTSSFISDYFADEGNSVTAIMAEKAVKPEKAKVLTYRTFSQLKQLLEQECSTGKYDVIIHGAAVSDYSPEKIIIDGIEYEAGDLSKVPSGSELSIKMKKNPKLLDSLKSLSGQKCKVFGFKLTSNASASERETAVKKIFSANSDTSLTPDYVISNDLSEINSVLHPCKIYNKDTEIVKSAENLTELCECINSLLYQ